METTIHKAKATEKKLKISLSQRFEKVYTRQRLHQPSNTGNPKYLPPKHREDNKSNMEIQRIREGKCKYCGEKWVPKHICNTRDDSRKLYSCEYEKDEDSQSEESEDEEVEDLQYVLVEI